MSKYTTVHRDRDGSDDSAARISLEEISSSTETSVEIIQVIYDRVATRDSERAILEVWQDPDDEDQIIYLARLLAGPETDLCWGASGVVSKGTREG